MIALWLGILGAVGAMLAWVGLVRRIVAPQVDAGMTVEPSSMPFGHTARLVIRLKNSSPLPCPLVTGRFTLPPGLELVTPEGVPDPHRQRRGLLPSDGQPVAFALTLGRRQQATVSFWVKGARRGRHAIQRLTLEVSDGFTGHREVMTFPVFVQVTVHPRRSLLRGARVQENFLGALTAYRKLAPTSVDWVDMRPYQVGDPIRDIAWMTSARRGELIVMERASSMSHVVVLVVSVRISAYTWQVHADHADRMYELALAFLEKLSRDGAVCYLYSDGYWGDGWKKPLHHLVLKGDGLWSPRTRQQAGHILGSLSAYPSVPLPQILSEVQRAVDPPARVLLAMAYEDEELQLKMKDLRRRGYHVERVPGLDVLGAVQDEGTHMR